MSKGCVVSWHGAGRGMRGLSDYGLDKEGAEIIISNCGHDLISIKQGLTRAVKNSLRVKNKACHLTISLPPITAPRTADQWRDIIEMTRQQLGLHDGFSYVAVRHTDTNNDHIHLIFSKISDEGKTWRDSNIRYKLPPLEKMLTEKFDLPPTPANQYATKGHINKNEIEWKIREGEQPPSVYIRNAITKALNHTDVLLFIKSLADAGITVRPNIKEGELNGFGYSYGGISYTGKSLGANWSDLKKVISYDKNIHLDAITQLKREIDDRKAGRDTFVKGASPFPGSANQKTGGAGSAVSRQDRFASTTDFDTSPADTGRTGGDKQDKNFGIRENKQLEQKSFRASKQIKPDRIQPKSLDNSKLSRRGFNRTILYRRAVIQIQLISRRLVRRLKAAVEARKLISKGFNPVKPVITKVTHDEDHPVFK